MHLNSLSLPFLAFLQSTALVAYISLVASIMLNGNKIFGPQVTLFGPILFLLLFIVSAVISATLFLGRSGYLFWEKRYKESFTLLGYTILWSLFYFSVVFIILLVNK